MPTSGVFDAADDPKAGRTSTSLPTAAAVSTGTRTVRPCAPDRTANIRRPDGSTAAPYSYAFCGSVARSPTLSSLAIRRATTSGDAPFGSPNVTQLAPPGAASTRTLTALTLPLSVADLSYSVTGSPVVVGVSRRSSSTAPIELVYATRTSPPGSGASPIAPL